MDASGPLLGCEVSAGECSVISEWAVGDNTWNDREYKYTSLGAFDKSKLPEGLILCKVMGGVSERTASHTLTNNAPVPMDIILLAQEEKGVPAIDESFEATSSHPAALSLQYYTNAPQSYNWLAVRRGVKPGETIVIPPSPNSTIQVFGAVMTPPPQAPELTIATSAMTQTISLAAFSTQQLTDLLAQMPQIEAELASRGEGGDAAPPAPPGTGTGAPADCFVNFE